MFDAAFAAPEGSQAQDGELQKYKGSKQAGQANVS